MAKTIGNPLSWSVQKLGATGAHLGHTAETLGGDGEPLPVPRVLTNQDLRAALTAGIDDFKASRADAVFAVLIYPIIGLTLVALGFHMRLLPLLFPLLAGFVLLGPVAAVGLYEISRRRELGEDVNWVQALGVIRSPSFGAIVIVGLYLCALFLVWIMTANAIYVATLGPEPPVSVGSFLRDVFTTSAGWTMIVVGCGVGALFAAVALAISVVSFPLLLDRNVGVPVAIVTSVRVAFQNPRVILTWGIIVAGAIVLGSIPLLLGLIVVMPILGHATWHLYRRAIE